MSFALEASPPARQNIFTLVIKATTTMSTSSHCSAKERGLIRAIGSRQKSFNLTKQVMIFFKKIAYHLESNSLIAMIRVAHANFGKR